MSESQQFGEKEWFSDRALAKQKALDEMPEGEVKWTDLVGIWEPRTQPTDDEKCHRCGSDAREGAGGDGHFCEIHIGRDCAAPDDCPADCARLTPPGDEVRDV